MVLAWYGSVAPMTSGALDRFPSSSVTPAFGPASEILAPWGARMTTRALAPVALAVGNFSLSRSNAFCDSVPGMEKVSAGGGGAEDAATPTPPKISTHRTTSSHRRRNARRPSL